MTDETVPDFATTPSDAYAIAVAERDIRNLRPTVDSIGPRFANSQGVYRFEWPRPTAVVVEVDHVHAERGGEVKAEVAVWSTQRGRAELLHRSQLTLSGIRSRQDLANYLTKRTPGEKLDWLSLIEAAAVQTIEEYRAGEPPMLMRDIGRPVSDGYILAPIVLEREPTIWFGDGGDGKSLLALAAAAAIASGRSDILGGIGPDRAQRVMYIDFEFSGEEHRDRLERICGSEMPEIVYVRCDAALTYETDRLRRIVRDRGAEFMVIDSVAFACHDAPETSIGAQEFFRAIRRIGLGALCVAHVTKADAGDQKPFGSAFWHNGARSTWYVKREGEGDRITLGMFNRKANVGSRSSALAFDLSFEPNRGPITFRKTDIRENAELAERLPVRVRLAHALRHGSMTMVELAAETESTVETVKKTISRAPKAFGRITGPDGITRITLATERLP